MNAALCLLDVQMLVHHINLKRDNVSVSCLQLVYAANKLLM